MKNFNFRALDFNNREELLWAARNYCENPSYWESNWKVDQSALDRQIYRIKDASSDASQRLLIAESELGDKVAFHWLKIETVEPGNQRYIGFEINDSETAFAQILHLWIQKEFWGQGLASELKQRGEAWAKERGASRIQTSVNYRNKRMFELNTRLGFEPGNIVMSKNL